MSKNAQSTKQAFARNVRWACDCMGFGSLKEAAGELGVGYDWLRRAVTQGVIRTRKDNPAVTNLADFFGVKKDVLWDEPGEAFRMAVLAKAKPDYLAHCLTLEAVLRHYGYHRPDLLSRCLDVIRHYKEKIDHPAMDSPEDRYCVIEASATGESLPRRSEKDWMDSAVEERLSRARLLPKRQILEEVVQARIERQLQRQKSLSQFDDRKSWESAKTEIVSMLVHLFLDAIQADGTLAVDDELRAKLAVVAEGYAKKLWDGEYAPGKEASGGK
jgi:hypothetical protein